MPNIPACRSRGQQHFGYSRGAYTLLAQQARQRRQPQAAAWVAQRQADPAARCAAHPGGRVCAAAPFSQGALAPAGRLVGPQPVLIAGPPADVASMPNTQRNWRACCASRRACFRGGYGPSDFHHSPPRPGLVLPLAVALPAAPSASQRGPALRQASGRHRIGSPAGA